MSLENVQLVQRLAKAYNERDMDTLDSLPILTSSSCLTWRV
jgi:hypothetical protein